MESSVVRLLYGIKRKRYLSKNRQKNREFLRSTLVVAVSLSKLGCGARQVSEPYLSVLYPTKAFSKVGYFLE